MGHILNEIGAHIRFNLRNLDNLDLPDHMMRIDHLPQTNEAYIP